MSSNESVTTGEVVEVPEMETLVAQLKTLESTDLFKVMKQALSEVEKRTKAAAKATKATPVPKKAGSMPKGVVPNQLRKPRAWVEFVLAHAQQNGWEPFTVHQTRKDKMTNEKIEEEIEMPGSTLHEGAYIYEDSVTEKTPNGKQIIHKDAMSLSKHYWAPKEKKGSREDLYKEFEESYKEEEISDSGSEVSSASTKKTVVKMTAAEKAAAAEAKKAEKAAAAEAKKAEKAAEKEAKKAEKEAEKAAKKAEKEAEKEAKKKPGTKSAVPAAAVKKTEVKEVKKEEVKKEVKKEEVKEVKVVKKPTAVKSEEWSCPADGMVHPWPYKGKTYLRNSDNEVWLKGADGGCGDWQGVYIPSEDRIDDSVPEPEFEDEE